MIKKSLLLIVIQTITIISVFSQTIKKPPIFEGSESLTVDFIGKGSVIFMYQNPEYKSIIDIVSFTIPNLDNAIALMDKVLYILEMPKTGEDEHIYDKFLTAELARYGFRQDVIYVSEKGSSVRGKTFDEKEAKELKEALLSKKK
jgi:hypothetical protein